MGQESDQGVAAQVAKAAKCCALLSEAQPVLDEIFSYEQQLNEVRSGQVTGGELAFQIAILHLPRLLAQPFGNSAHQITGSHIFVKCPEHIIEELLF